MSYLRKINAFAVDAAERWAFAGNANGELLVIDIDSFAIVRELRVCCGAVEAVDVHPTLPYVAVLGGDKTMAICRWDDGRLERIHWIALRDIIAENTEYQFKSPNMPLSQALAFHPTLPRLLTRNMSGAALELGFDDAHWEVRWCHGYFARPDGGADDVTYIRYLHETNHVFCSGRGGLVVVDPEHREQPLVRWQYDDQNIHIAEHVDGTEYLLASDSRRVFRFDVTGKKPPRISPFLCRDHLERISLNKRTGRAFFSSFDRNIYELDPATLESKIVVETPFKLRWLHSLERTPSLVIIQCRNGSLYKVDLETKQLLGVLKETPNALWSGVATDSKHIYVAGEGPQVLQITASGDDRAQHRTQLDAKWVDFGGEAGRYTKRMIVHPQTGAMLLGRSDGEIRIASMSSSGAHSRQLAHLGVAIRDLAVPPQGYHFWAACEDGRVHRIDLETGKVLATFVTPNDEPFWAISYNPERRLLAVAERHGELHFVDAEKMTAKSKLPGTNNVKRMRWLDKNRLLTGLGSSIFMISVDTGKMELAVPHQTNSVEDFGWDEERRYLALVHYHCNVVLFDLKSFVELDHCAIDMDFPHGLVWLPKARSPDAHPYELLAYGRSGVAHRFRVHSDRLINLGIVNHELATPILDEGIRVR